MKKITRYRALAATFAAGLVLAAAPAGAQADPITGQDHPADVFAAGLHYFPAEVHIHSGESLTFGNYDIIEGIPAHSLVEYIPGCTAPPYGAGAGTDCPAPRFGTGLVDWSFVRPVSGAETLPPGSYEFVCQVHPQMRGTLIVD